jgi:hypothetical protein
MKMYMTIEEVAQSLRVTVPTVRWHVRKAGLLRRSRWGGGCSGMRRLSPLGLRQIEKRRPGEYPTKRHAGWQGALPGAHQSGSTPRSLGWTMAH